MAETWGSRQLRHEREMDARLIRELRELGQGVGRVVLRHATARDEAGERIVPNTRSAREALRRDIWREALKPYFIGSGDEALDGPTPRSPYTRLMVEGIKGAVEIQAERQVAIIGKACKDELVQRWLTSSRPAGMPVEMAAFGLIREQGPRDRRLSYDPFHTFVDPNGYRLSDRVWNTSVEVRRRIDQVLDYQIPRHMSAVDMAELVEQYMTPEAAAMRTSTPYGREGSYAARRLTRTEITAAAGRSAVSANLANPYVDGTDWALSASHPGKGPEPDICDDLCSIDKAGQRVREPYPNDGVPAYPPHPHCVTPGQPVRTIAGDVPIEAVKEGDLVLTHEGRHRRVLAAWSRPFDGLVYEFTTESGSFEVTGNHPVLTRRGWVNAEAVQLGDEVLYNAVGVAQDALVGVAEYAPAEGLQIGVTFGVVSGLPIMPSPVAFDGDESIDQGEVDVVAPDLVLALIDKPSSIQGFQQGDLWRGGVGEAQIAMAFEHGHEARIIGSFGGGDLLSDYFAARWIVITREVDPGIDFIEHLGSLSAARAVVVFPGEFDGFAPCAELNVALSHQLAESSKLEAETFAYLDGVEALGEIEVFENLGEWTTEFGLNTAAMLLQSGLRGHIGNLSSLPLGEKVGAAPRNAVVEQLARPLQAHLNYNTIRAIRVRRYEGPVFNMEVEEDHSYMVNGAAVHNCFCHLRPAVTRTPAQVTAQLRAEIQAATPRAMRLRGAFNPDWLSQALLAGTFLAAVLGWTEAEAA